MTNNNNTDKTLQFLKAMHEGLSKLQEQQAQIRARMTPEQLAEERRQIQVRQIAKEEKEKAKLNEFFKSWLKRDAWLIYDEAMPLTKAEKPEEETILNLRDGKLWSLVQSCAGHSLQIINLDAKPKQWRVKPFEWVSWLKLKEQYIHPQLEALIYPQTSIQPTLKTAKAIQSREIKKRDRQKAIKVFATEAETLAKKQNIDWSNEAIPVTKSDFLEVLAKVNPAYKKISIDTFDRDIADIGLKFKRGTKSSKNNVLKEIFGIS